MVSASGLVQIEIHVSNLEASKRFFAEVFGWRGVPAELHNYVVLEVDEQSSFGISLAPSNRPQANQSLILYFKVADASQVADRAVQFGGAKRFGPTKLPSYGNIWQIADPDGHWFGLFEPAAMEQLSR